MTISRLIDLLIDIASTESIDTEVFGYDQDGLLQKIESFSLALKDRKEKRVLVLHGDIR